MDTTQLRIRYPEGIPQKLEEELHQFQQLIDSKGAVRCRILANFGKDIELSYSKGYDIFKGFVLELSKDYTLSEHDKFWLHPQLLKTRNLYESPSREVKDTIANNKFNIAPCGSSVAFYTTHSFDEIGGYKEQDFVIIDSSKDDIAETAVDHWINGAADMRKVYSDLHTLKFDGKTLKDHTDEYLDEIKESVGDLQLVSTSSYNTFLRSKDTYLFYNHALKANSNEKALIHISPLMGYAMVKGRGQEFEADLLSSSDYLDVSKFTEEQRKRAYVSCRWDGRNIVNTFTLRKPIENYKKWFDEEKITSYRMETGYFSNTPNVIDKLDPEIILFLSPEATMIPQEKDVHSHIKKNIIKLPATKQLLHRLVDKHWKTVFSKKFISTGDNLALPRDLLKELIK